MSVLPDMPVLADRLIYMRKIKGLTQAQLAAMAGTSQQAIQQAETGKALRPRYLPQLAKGLGVPIGWLALNDAGTDGPLHLSEQEDAVLSMFKAMPAKEQELMMELMKSRGKKPGA